MTKYSNGRALEYKIRNALEQDGYQCIRAAGSKGAADLVCLKPSEVLLIQVKATNPQIPPAERLALLELARITGAKAIVAHKPARKPVVYRELTGPGPKDHRPFTTDQIGEPV